MIKIINGVFGYNNGKSVIPKTSQDAPFECDKAIEKRLVSIGVAEYVTKVVGATEAVEASDPAEIIEEPTPEPPVTEECACADFTDINREAWYHEAVDYALENGIMNGIGNNKFDPVAKN